jgi:hypothetical protein
MARPMPELMRKVPATPAAILSGVIYIDISNNEAFNLRRQRG